MRSVLCWRRATDAAQYETSNEAYRFPAVQLPSIYHTPQVPRTLHTRQSNDTQSVPRVAPDAAASPATCAAPFSRCA